MFPNRKALINTLKSQAILNASNAPLSDLEIETLCLGLNFIPAHQKTTQPRDTDDWIQDLNTMIHFSQNKENQITNKGWLQSIAPSTWAPPPQEWEANPVCANEVNKLRRLLHQKQTPLHRDIAEAAQNLGARPDIHILKADKGRNVVIWPTHDYDKEADRNFSDPLVYQELTQIEYQGLVTTLKQTATAQAKFLLDSGLITNREFEYMTTGNPSGSIIYFLPKTHKPINPTSNTFAGRPIVATYTSSTHGIDQYLTQLTAPILERIPGSLKDTTDLLKKLPSGKLPQTAEIYTADVDSLYPSIPWAGGLDAATGLYARFLPRLRGQANEKKRLQPPPVHIFRELLELVITNAFITFKNKRFFHQRSGTAMGTCISVFFANAYMYQVTAEIIIKPPPEIILFERYIDDLIVIVNNHHHDKMWAAKFFQGISNPFIKYTINTDSSQEQCYLDVRVSINATTRTLDSEPYKKPTSSGNYLHPASSHPKHVIDAIPYSQFLRIRRISSSEAIYDQYAKRLTRDLRKSGYKSRNLKKAMRRARLLRRETLLGLETINPGPTKSRFANSIKFITPYGVHTNWKRVRKQIKKTQQTIVNHYINQGKTEIVSDLNSRQTELVFENKRNIGSYFSASFKHPEA